MKSSLIRGKYQPQKINDMNLELSQVYTCKCVQTIDELPKPY